MKYYKEMTEYHNLTEQELEEGCIISSCCPTMGKNVFEGDVYYDCIGFGLKDCFYMKYCPFCGNELNKNTMDIDLVKFVYTERNGI